MTERRKNHVRSKAPLTVDKPLTVKEQRFVDEVIQSGNATEAAGKAGYRALSYDSLAQKAKQLKQKPNVAAEIARRMAAASHAADLAAADVLKELKPLVRSSMAHYLTQDKRGLPVFKKLSDLTEDQLAAISEMTIDTETIMRGKKKTIEVRVDRIKFKLYDKHAAIVTLGRYFKLFADLREPATVNNNIIVVVQNALSATDGILERIIAGAALEGHAPALPNGPLLPAEVHSPPA